MATRIARFITQKLLTSSVIEEGDKELYCYGFFLLITRFFFFLITVFVGFLAGIPSESILFHLVFISLRTYAGGVHAKTEAACTILTTLALTASVFGIRAIERTNCDLISVLMLVSGSLCILLFSPLDTKDKPLTSQEKRHYQLICYVIALLWIVSALIARILSLNIMYYPITFGIFLEGILLSIGKLRNCKQ